MIEAQSSAFWRATFALSLGSMLVFSCLYVTQPLLPMFTEQFFVSETMSTMTVSAAILALGLGLLVFGPLSDALGRKNVMGLSLLVSAVLTIAAGFAPGFYSLIAIRVLQGFFLAGLAATAIAYIGEEFHKAAIGMAIGLYISGNTIGGMLGRISSGYVAEEWGWRASFWSLGWFALLCTFVFWWLLPASKQFVGGRLQWRQATTAMIHHVQNRRLLLAYGIGGLHFFVFVGVYNFITYLLSDAPYYLPASLIGLLFMTYLSGTVASTLAGRAMTRWTRTLCVRVGIVFIVLGLLLTLFESLTMIALGLLVFCFGIFFSHATTSTWVSEQAASSKASASSLYLFFYYLGGSLGSLYLSLFWNAFQWKGIVIGCMTILILTWSITYGLGRFESKAMLLEQQKAHR